MKTPSFLNRRTNRKLHHRLYDCAWISALIATMTFSLSGCSKKLQLKAVRAQPTSVESSVTTTSAGTVIADQQAVLGFGSSGRVAKISVKPGDRVKKGQLLAELDNRELKAIYEDSTQELKRAHELFAAGLVSRAALDEAIKNQKITQANLDRTLIHAPFEGIITEINLETGELPQSPATPTARAPIRIVDLKPRLIRGNIDEIDLSKIHVGTPTRVRIPAIGTQWIPGEVRRVVPFVSTAKEQERTSEIEIKINDPSQALIPVGASAEVEIITQQKNNALALPTRVVLGKIGQRHVFRFENGKIEQVSVKTGIGNYDRTEILSGIKKDEIVIYPPDDTELKSGLSAKIELLPWP